MDPEFPLNRLILRAGSLAQDLTFVSLVDASDLFFEGSDPQGLLIGGQMVTLHAYRWGLGASLFRESQDTDMGVPIVALKDASLLGRIETLGYVRTSGNTFAKPVDDLPSDLPAGGGRNAIIELLAPAYTSRARESVKYGEFAVTEAPGLAVALLRPNVSVDLSLTRLNNQESQTHIRLPDEAGCLILRAHAWRIRGEDRDAIDVWRALEIASLAGVKPGVFEAGPATEAAAIVRKSFGTEDSAGTRAALDGRSMVPTAPLGPRIAALVRDVVGS